MKRRDFLKAGMLGAAGFALSGLTFMVPRRADAAAVNVIFTAERALKTMIDGNQVPVWQFRSSAGSGPGALTSGLVVQEGDMVHITLMNNLDGPINFFIPGVGDLKGPEFVVAGGQRRIQLHRPGSRQPHFYLSGPQHGEPECENGRSADHGRRNHPAHLVLWQGL